jgi:hypothetical protein
MVRTLPEEITRAEQLARALITEYAAWWDKIQYGQEIYAIYWDVLDFVGYSKPSSCVASRAQRGISGNFATRRRR